MMADKERAANFPSWF